MRFRFDAPEARALAFPRAPYGRAEEHSELPGKGKLFEAMDGRVVYRPADREHRRDPDGRKSVRRDRRGGLSFGYFSLATQRKVTRSPQASESTECTDYWTACVASHLLANICSSSSP